MKVAIFAYSRQGCKIARRVEEHLKEAEMRKFTVARLQEPDFESIRRPGREFYGELFAESDAMIFVASCGLAVREIAAHVRDKRSDPAVIVIDELATFVIPLLSGHIGGANELALDLAQRLGSTPVITTATDINKRFSVDTWASKQGFAIANIKTAKDVSAAILEADLPFYSDFPVKLPYPNGIFAGEEGDIGIYVGYRNQKPFRQTLQIIPPVLHLGIGCRRGTSAELISEAAEDVFRKHGISKKAVKCIASIDLKADEEGLNKFARSCNLEVNFYPAERLAEISGDFSSSSFVRSVTGVDSVCERAAMVGADHLIVKKTALNGVTVAVAEENLEVSFV